MKAVADMVTPGNILADVGTDHGYVPIALVKEQVVPSAIAMDLREGPLKRAKEHIIQFGLEKKIQTRLSDGVLALQPNEAQSILIAGMGGELVIHILTQGESVCHAAEELILQPQSDLGKVRKFLRDNKYRIVAENMVFEDGKYYPMMKVVSGVADRVSEDVQEIYDLYGPLLLQNKNPVLISFLERQYQQLWKIYEELKQQPDSERITERRSEVQNKIIKNEKAQKMVLGGSYTCRN